MELPPQAKKALASYAPVFVGAGLWAYARFPEQLGWATGAYAKLFNYLAIVYDNMTEIRGYGDALDDALHEVKGIPPRILDLGTGTGYVARKLKRLYPASEIVATDISPEMIGVAEHLSMAEKVDIEYHVADSGDLPFPDGHFDLVVLQNSVPFPEETMRVLVPGGRTLFVISWAGPWVELAWPALAARFEESGAVKTWGRKAGYGFAGFADKAE